MPPPTEPATSLDAERLLAELVERRLLDGQRGAVLLEEFRSEADDPSGESFLDYLVQVGLLTTYQSERIGNGDYDQLQYGPYTLMEPMGQSSTLGTVYRAIHRIDRQRYALRVLPLRNLFKAHTAKVKLGAYRSLAPHPTVVPFADLDTANGAHYFAWPFVEGETLAHSVRRVGPLEPAAAAKFFAAIAEGLAHVHSAGLIHGALQPSCLLISQDREARLLDLGVGAILAENAADGSGMIDTISMASVAQGQIDYAAPESLVDASVQTPASDAYALGCCLYFALTGLPPFPEASSVQKILGHQSRAPVAVRSLAPQVPVPLSNVLDRLLAKSPAVRLASMGDIREELLRSVGLDTEPIPTPVEVRSQLRSSADGPTNFAIPRRASFTNASGVISFDMDDLPQEALPDIPVWSKSSVPPSSPQIDTPPEMAAMVEVETPRIRTVHLPNATDSETKSQASRQKNKKFDSTQLATVPSPISLGSSGSLPEIGIAIRRPKVIVPPPPIFGSKAIGAIRSLAFWMPKSDAVQVSIFGPPEIVPGQRVEFIAYLHLPESFDSVSTLCRALRHDADLLGTGYLDVPIPRGTEIGVHLALENAGVAKSLQGIPWNGQTVPRSFDVFVPWESPYGLAAGVLSAGWNDRRVGTVSLHFVVLQRTA